MSSFPYDFGAEEEGSSWEERDRLRIFELPDLNPKIPGIETTDLVDATTAVHGWDSEFVAFGDLNIALCLDAYVVNGTCNLTESGGFSSPSPNATIVSAYNIWQMAVLGFLAGITSIVTVVGNLIVILSFIIDRSIRQPTNYFIASLAVSDLLIGSISMPFYTIYLLAGKKWMLGPVLCDLWLSIDYTVCLSSIYTVFCITIDRFCSVIIPAKYRDWRTERRVLAMIGATWIVPSLLFFISIFGWQHFVGIRTVLEEMCYVQYLENPVFSCLLQVGYFWITLIVMCVLYTGIYRVALKLAQRSEQKHKKMTSLVSVAGRTVTRIGVGVTQKQNIVAAVDAEPDPVDQSTPPTPEVGKDSKKKGAGPVETKNSALHAVNNRIIGKTDEGSSSTGYPSDTDPGSSQSAVSSHRRNGDTTKGGSHRQNTSETIPKLQPPPSGKISKDPPLDRTRVPGATQISCRAEVQRADSATHENDDVNQGDVITSGQKKEEDGASNAEDCVLSFPSPKSYRRNLDPELEPEIDGELVANDLNPTKEPSKPKSCPPKAAPPPPSKQQQYRRIGLGYFRRGRGSSKDKGTTSSKSKSSDRHGSKTKAVGRAPSQPQASKSENRAKKALRTISVILGAFVLCWTPWHVLSLVIGFYGSEIPLGLDMLYDISYWLCYLNSPINPFCYALANQQFKKTFSRILKFDWHRT